MFGVTALNVTAVTLDNMMLIANSRLSVDNGGGDAELLVLLEPLRPASPPSRQ